MARVRITIEIDTEAADTRHQKFLTQMRVNDLLQTRLRSYNPRVVDVEKIELTSKLTT